MIHIYCALMCRLTCRNIVQFQMSHHPPCVVSDHNMGRVQSDTACNVIVLNGNFVDVREILLIRTQTLYIV